MENVNLTPKDIVNKHFKQKCVGTIQLKLMSSWMTLFKIMKLMQKKINVYKWKMIVY